MDIATPRDVVAAVAEEALRFGTFTLRPTQRVLMEGDARIHLGSRAFDILLLLLERAGTFVANHEIVRRVWPTTVVVEGNLRVHVTALRKALGDGRDGRRYIVNAPNRGYSFVAPVSRTRADPPPAAHPAGERTTPGLIPPLHRMAGAGGIGKAAVAASSSSAALAATERSPWNGVHGRDLAPPSDAPLVPGALAAVLGPTAVMDDAMPINRSFLHDKSLLLLLDHCEHVLAAAAELAETLLRRLESAGGVATGLWPRPAVLSWELRTAATLGRVWMEQGRKREALELLRSALAPLTEGHSTSGVQEAVALLDALVRASAPPA